LLIGIFGNSLAFIFVSIGASFLAAIVLAVLSQMNKRKGREVAVPSGVAVDAAIADVAPATRVDQAPLAAPAAAASVAAGMPISNYETLRVNEILPALEKLDLDQLEAVAQHEETGKNRTTVLNRIDQRMDELEAAEAGSAARVAEATGAIDEPTIVSAAGVADGFPIPDYGSLSEAEVIDLLEDLDADQLETVADREEAGPNRDAVLDAIDDRLDILEGIVQAPAKKVSAAPKKAATTAKKAASAPAKKTASRTPAKKAAPSRAPAKKATASRAPTKKTTASRAPAKKTTASRTPAKKAAASRATVKKAASNARKASPVKKAGTAKKAGAAKKAGRR
jgi:hypothetical protein